MENPRFLRESSALETSPALFLIVLKPASGAGNPTSHFVGVACGVPRRCGGSADPIIGFSEII